jgi:chromosome segregation ATPase
MMSEEKRLMENPKYSILEDQISSLKKAKNASEAFFSKIRSIINEVGEAQTSIGYDALEDWILKHASLLVELKSQLESFQTEKDNLSRELERAQEKISELSLSVQHAEKNLVESRKTIDSQAHVSTSLESQIERLEEQIEDLHKSQHSSSVFFGRLDTLLRISTDRAAVSDESQHETRLDSIKNLQSRFQDGLMKLKESQNYVIRLESKSQELEDQLRILQESHTQIESKSLESDKLCEEAISASETLAKEVGEVRSELAMEQKAHQVLLTAHNAALGDNKELSRKFDKIMTQVVERDQEISRLNLSFNTCHEEKAQLKDQLSSIRIKTVDVMKQHIEVLRVDYARRIEEFKAGYVLDHENEELSRLRLDLSNKEAENVNLRRRNEHIEKSTSLKIHNAEEKLCQIQGELTSVSKEAFIQREEKNAMQEELDHLRSLMDIAEESVGELNRLKEENQQLTAMIRYQNDQGSRLSSIDVPFEIRGRSDEDHLMHERISALMRENEQNNISMRTLQVSSREDTL